MATMTAPRAAGTIAAASGIMNRLESLDVFRGLTMASMVMVNNAGDWTNVYAPLRHAEWHGWTFTDMVFPFFLWIVGVAMTLSTARRVERGENKSDLIAHAFRRAAIIFAIGLLLNGFPHYNLSTIRIPGVLQRIAICYLIATLIFLYTNWKGQLAAIAGCLASYWAMMAPWGYGKGSTFAQYVDGLYLKGHMYGATKTWDPEGIVSTLPAIGTALFGFLCGHLLRAGLTDTAKALWMAGIGAALTIAGLITDAWQPINKQLWTVPYTMLMAGLAFLVFGACYYIVDVRGLRGRWTKPLVIMGMNAMAVYILSGTIARLMSLIQVSQGVSLKMYLYRGLFAPLASPINSSLLWALANVAVCWLAAWGMYRRGWFLKF